MWAPGKSYSLVVLASTPQDSVCLCSPSLFAAHFLSRATGDRSVGGREVTPLVLEVYKSL